MSLLIYDALRYDPGARRVGGGWLYASEGKIQALGAGDTWRRSWSGVPGGVSDDATVVVDAGGGHLVPGFIDLHAHGGGGHRFEGGPVALRAALDVHRRHGTTGLVASLASSDLGSLARSLGDVAELAGHDPLVLGSHLEGPYLSPHQCGAHDTAMLRQPDPGEISALLRAARGSLRQLTIAPELSGALDAIRRLVAAGVVAAVGHTEADYDQARAAFDAGATLLTHAYNAMPQIGHRAPGPVVAAFDDERVSLEIINDGHHVDPRVVALTFAQAPGRVALVTDAMAAAGLGDGRYLLGRREVTVVDGTATLSGTATLAGSTITSDESLRRAVATGIEPVNAVAAVTSVPADVLGLGDRRGRISIGYRADLVLLDADWKVTRVFSAGTEVARVAIPAHRDAPP